MNIMKILIRNVPEISSIVMCDSSYRQQVIQCAINTRDLTKNLVRVKSSNLWAYALNIKTKKDKTGDMLVQFKNTQGGPGDIYIYYGVPVLTYRRMLSAPSKGHAFWVYIRNKYPFAKLTGDKRTKQQGGIN